MSNKLYFLISFVLVLSLAGNVLAYDIMMWDNDEGNGDRLWDNAANWMAPGKIPKVPEAPDWVELSEYYGDPNNGPIINADMNAAVCEWIDFGYYTSGADVILTMEGGSLTVGLWLSMGYYQGGNYRLDITGGTIDVNYVYVGVDTDTGTYTINMSGGAFNTPGYQKELTPWDFGYLAIGTGLLCTQADMNMTGGYADVGWLQIGSWDTRTGKGHVDLHGGTLEADILGMGGGGEGTMDFAGGTLIIDGDYRVPNGWLFDPCSDTPLDWGENEDYPIDFPIARVDWDGYTGTIGILAKRGLITAYGTKVGDIITDDVNYPSVVGQRAVINLDYDVANPGQTTITAGAVDPNLAWDPDPLHFSGGYSPTDVNLLSWAAGDNAVSHDVYLGTDFAEVNEASDPNTLPGRGRQALADVNYPVSGVCVWGTTYYWRIDEVNGPTTWKGTVWNFTIRPAWARNPKPTGARAALFPVLTWMSGPLVATTAGHYVYFSSDFNDVNDRDPNFLTIRDTNDYRPTEMLEFSKQYWWAVDEFNGVEEPNLWLSPNWSFTTEAYLFVDNMESYENDEAMKDVWNDYWTTGVRSDVYIEKSADWVRNGDISMRFKYDNLAYGGDKTGYSEAWALASDLWASTNWTVGGAKALVLYFHGKVINTEPSPLYLVLSDGTNEGMVTYDDANGVQEEFWHPWYIDLEDPCFTTGATPNPVDMSSIEKIYLGVGVRGYQVAGGKDFGEGSVYFDDIGLYPSMCFPDQVETDFTNDCITNYEDLDVMARDWLMYDYNVPAVAISGDPCGWWKLDEGEGATTVDSSGYGNHGTITHASWSVGYPNDPNDSGLHFDADGIAYYDRVICAERTGEGNQPGDYPAELMPATFTVACWAKIDSFDYFEGLVGNGTDWGYDECGFYLYSSGFSPGGSGNENFGLMISTEDSGLSFVETQNIYKTDTWYHLAATYNDANMVSMYVDGELVQSGSARGGSGAVPFGPIRPTDVGGPIKWISDNDNYPPYFAIGAFPSGDNFNLATWYYADATIDEVRVYGYAMPYGEIVTLAEQGPTLYHDLISPANIYDLEAKTSKKVNFRDYVILADHWLEGPVLWP